MEDFAGGDLKNTQHKVIGTPSGKIHCPEALACFMLKKLPEYSSAEIKRSNNQEVLDTCDIVVGVGGVYDHNKHRYDYHQSSFSGTMNSLGRGKSVVRETKLTSAGLVYLHFGEEVLKELIKPSDDKEKLDAIYDQTYKCFVEEIDAKFCNGEPRFKPSTDLSSRVRNLNPNWNEKAVKRDDRFKEAVDLVGSEFVDRVNYYSTSWWPARSVVEDAVERRFDVYETGEIVRLSRALPWKDHLYDIEKKIGAETEIKYVLYEDKEDNEESNWRVQCVAGDNRINRLPLPEEWRGLRDDELSRKANIPQCTFVHRNGYIGGNETKEGALQMAVEALRMGNLEAHH